MDLLFAICQAIGLGLACGIGGPLAWLFIAVMAGAGAGFDPVDTDYGFVGSGWYIALLFAANVADFFQRSRNAKRSPAVIAAGTAVIAALFGAAALAADGEAAILGFVLAGLAAGASALVALSVLEGAQRRRAAASDAAPDGTLALIFGFAGIVVAAFALFAPPVALLALFGLGYLAAGRRRKAGEKYEGLRILR